MGKPGKEHLQDPRRNLPGMRNGGREAGRDSKDLTGWAWLSPEFVFGAPTWSWTLGAVSALCPPLSVPKALTLLFSLIPPT